MSENNYKDIWSEALDQIGVQYKKENLENEFNLWYNCIEYLRDKENTITVSIQSEFMQDKVIKRGNIKKIKEKIKEICGSDVEIEFEIKPLENSAEPAEQEEEKHKKATSQKPSQKSEANTEKHSDLDQKFTFANFVPGDNNMFAYRASMEVAKKPGENYNPILLYGGSGLGKTHLMQSIGNFIWQKSEKPIKLSYLNAESLLNEFTHSLSTKTAQKFKNKYRGLDVFLLDDIHFMQGKEALQEEVFYIFEALNQKHAQMVFTCDRPINELKGITERLKTRFNNGICIDMQPPNYETRKAILLKKMELLGKNVADEIIDYIAQNIETNVRDLEGAFKKVVAYSELINEELTLEMAKENLQIGIDKNSNEKISIETIQKAVAEHFEISFQDIKSKRQTKKIAQARHIAIYISRTLTEDTFTQIGEYFGGKDHSTIMNSNKKISDLIKTDPMTENIVQTIIKKIKNDA